MFFRDKQVRLLNFEVVKNKVAVAGEISITNHSQTKSANQELGELFDLAELGKGVFEGSPDCVKVLDADGRILAMNRNGMCSMEIDDFKTVQGASWATLWTEENRHEIQAAINAAREGRNYSLNLACPTAKGSSRWWEVTVSPIVGDDGAVDRILSVSRDITEARFATENVRVSEARFRSLVTATAAIVWGTPGSGHFDSNQPGWSAFTGQLYESMKGLGWLDAVHPDDREKSASLWHQSIAKGTMYQTEHRLRRADGIFRHMSVRAVPITGRDNAVTEWIGVHTDIHDRKEAEVLRQRSEERVRLATEAAELGFWVWMPSTDEVTWENERPYQIFGIPSGAPPITARQFLTDFVDPDHIAKFSAAAKNTLETGAQLHFQGRITRPDGECRWVEFFGNLQPATASGSACVIGTVADITSTKDREEELRRLAANLSEADRRKTEFLAVLAHELRNPLAPIRHGLDLLRMQSNNAAMLSQVRDMLDRQVNQMVRLVNDLLDIARITSGKVALRKQRAEMCDLINVAVETSMPLIDASKHHLTVSIAEGSIPVEVDPERITQVVSNLLNNAAKYTSVGGQIALNVVREGSEVVVSVTDSGIGIAPQSIDTVFELFRQVGQNFERSQGGLGIGLSLVRQLVELHGGSVSAASAGEGHGCIFTIRLAMFNTANELPDAAKSSFEQTTPDALRILIADDNIDAAQMLSMLLETQGHVATITHDGHAALKLARELQPHLVLLDIGMPGLNGYEVAKAMRAIPSLAGTTLVALTGWGGEQDLALSRDAGFDRHLIKPADMKDIESVLAKISRAVRS